MVRFEAAQLLDDASRSTNASAILGADNGFWVEIHTYGNGGGIHPFHLHTLELSHETMWSAPIVAG